MTRWWRKGELDDTSSRLPPQLSVERIRSNGGREMKERGTQRGEKRRGKPGPTHLSLPPRLTLGSLHGNSELPQAVCIGICGACACKVMCAWV